MSRRDLVFSICAVVATIAVVVLCVVAISEIRDLKTLVAEKLENIDPLVTNTTELTANSKVAVGHLKDMAAPFASSGDKDVPKDQAYATSLSDFLRGELEGQEVVVITEGFLGSEKSFDDWVPAIKREAGLWAQKGSSNKDILWHVSMSFPARRKFMLKFKDSEELVWVADWVRQNHAPSAGIVFDDEKYKEKEE